MVLLLAGCDSIFSTRPVQPPERISNSRWEPATTPEQVLTNMENTFLDRNPDNYVRSLSDSTAGERPFRFIPDAESDLVTPQTFKGWSVADERRVFQEMTSSVPGDSLFQLAYGDNPEVIVTGDTAWIDVDYTLRIHHTKSAIPRRAQGQARFSLCRNSQRNWVIYEWMDVRQDKYATWSDLKAAF